VFCIYLRTNSDLCHLQHNLVGFYNRDEKCLQRGTDWGFKYSGLRFVFKGLIVSPFLSPIMRNVSEKIVEEIKTFCVQQLIFLKSCHLQDNVKKLL
jgi:hypothetical protein